MQIHRDTVGRHLQAAKPAISTPGSTAGRVSLCREFLPAIEAGVQAGLSAKRIHQDLASEHGFTGSYQSVKRCVRQLAARLELPVRRLECAPGEEMQVDFGQGAWVIDEQGTVEAGVKYVQANALMGRSFPCLQAQNLLQSEWERTVADTRIK